eukprot:UN09642
MFYGKFLGNFRDLTCGFIYNLPAVLYNMIIGSSLCVIFMVIGILLGIWIQRKHDVYHTVTNVVMEP